MKKMPFYLCAGILAISLVSCGSKSNANAKELEFQEGFEFVRELSFSEKQIVRSNVLAQKDNVTKISVSVYSSEQNELATYSSERGETIELFANDYTKRTYSHLEEETTGGATYNSTYEGTIEYWSDEEENAVVTYTKGNDEGIEFEDFDREVYTDDSKEEVVDGGIHEQLNSVINTALSTNIYEDKKGNLFTFYSSVSETYTAVEWGTETKVLHQLERMQISAKFNSDYEITQASYYYDLITNQDPTTNNWYDKDQTVEKYGVQYVLKYGTRTANESRVAELNDYVDGEFIYNATPKAQYGVYDSDAGTFTAGSTYSAYTNVVRKGYSDYHVQAYYNLSLSSTQNAFSLYMSKTSFESIGSTSSVTENVNFTLENSIENTATANVDDVNLIIAQEDSMSLAFALEFDFNGEEVSNIVYYAL